MPGLNALEAELDALKVNHTTSGQCKVVVMVLYCTARIHGFSFWLVHQANRGKLQQSLDRRPQITSYPTNVTEGVAVAQALP